MPFISRGQAIGQSLHTHYLLTDLLRPIALSQSQIILASDNAVGLLDAAEMVNGYTISTKLM